MHARYRLCRPLAVGRSACAVLLLALSAGCGERVLYPVQGQLVDQQGNPIPAMKGGTVEFESVEHKMSAHGRIDEKGDFKLSTATPGDGARLGKHRVLITRPYLGADHPSPPIIDPKYEKFETSGLEATVEPRINEIKFTVNLYQP